MPVYAYSCKDCGHSFDIRQSFSDNALTQCPVCGGHLRKKFNTVGVVFKGSGFYRNDSRSASTDASSSASTTDQAAPAESTKKSDSANTSTTASASD